MINIVMCSFLKDYKVGISSSSETVSNVIGRVCANLGSVKQNLYRIHFYYSAQ